MHKPVRKVAVLGSGVMGSAIAAHFANAGVPSLVLDIVPKEPTEPERDRDLGVTDRPVRKDLLAYAYLPAARPVFDADPRCQRVWRQLGALALCPSVQRGDPGAGFL